VAPENPSAHSQKKPLLDPSTRHVPLLSQGFGPSVQADSLKRVNTYLIYQYD